MLKQEWRNLVLLALVTLLSFAVGWWSIRDHGITFWFDQSRDAHVASQIISQRDFKLLGPSASGTNDTVYHGVLYYYFIAPLYAIGGGEPMVPALALLFMGCLGVFPLYYFVKSFTGANMAAWLAVLAYAFSVEVIQLSYWLSNPSLAVTPLIVFYWSLWELGCKNNKAFMVPLAIALGICLQAALWLIYLFGPLLVAILYNMDHFGKRSVLRDWPNSLRAALIVLLFVASIIIGQFMLWRNGVFLADGVSTSLKVVDVAALLPLVKNYLVKALQTLGPYTPVAAAAMLGALILGFGKLSSTQRFFLASWLLGPCWLFLLEPRSSIHILISVEIALMIIGAILLTKLWARQTVLPKVIVTALVGTYLFSNLMMLRAHQLLSSNIFSPQQGSNLADQLALIDYTYAQAATAPFTFSAFTNPNGYFITWAYLYDWYGQNKYGYKPTFVGPEQTGLFGADLLARDDVSRAAVHFTITEPNLDIVPQVTRDAFSAEQERLAPVVATTVFGSTVVELRLLE